MSLLTVGDQFPDYRLTSVVGGDFTDKGPDKVFQVIDSTEKKNRLSGRLLLSQGL